MYAKSLVITALAGLALAAPLEKREDYRIVMTVCYLPGQSQADIAAVQSEWRETCNLVMKNSGYIQADAVLEAVPEQNQVQGFCRIIDQHDMVADRTEIVAGFLGMAKVVGNTLVKRTDYRQTMSTPSFAYIQSLWIKTCDDDAHAANMKSTSALLEEGLVDGTVRGFCGWEQNDGTWLEKTVDIAATLGMTME